MSERINDGSEEQLPEADELKEEIDEIEDGHVEEPDEDDDVIIAPVRPSDVRAEQGGLIEDEVDGLFDGGVFGARDDLSVNRDESEIREIKAMVIEDLLEKEGIDPSELISFGDGYVEVQLVAERGGLAIGVATNEDTRTGINEWKRGRLIVAGAKAIAPDFSQPEELMKLLDRR